MRPPCSVGGCNGAHKGLGYCIKHYYCFKRNGTAVPKERHWRKAAIPLEVLVRTGLCECGCGLRTKIATRTHTGHGIYAGFPNRFLVGHGNAKGRSHIDQHGYRLIRNEDHSASGSRGYVAEHRVVMAQIIGRKLWNFETAHHLNGIRSDNRPENLELWAKPQVPGQRVQDLVNWVIENYLTEIEVALKEREAHGHR